MPRASLEADWTPPHDTMDTLARSRNLDEESHRRAADAGRETVRRSRSTNCSTPSTLKCKVVHRGRCRSSRPTPCLPEIEYADCRTRRSRIGRSAGKVRRLWARDASLWTGRRRKQVGWAGSASPRINWRIRSIFESIAAEIKQAGFKHALLLGMGGSSLCPEVLAR